MSKHYTEDELTKAARAILDDDMAKGRAADEWQCADQDWLTDNARAALDAVAPAIAASALRDFAESFALRPGATIAEATVAHEAMCRADQIDGGDR